eukprot:6206548-Pleurochrysis_carterae.AAC.4
MILTGFGSDGIMAAVRAIALVCESLLLMLLRLFGSDAHTLDFCRRCGQPLPPAFFEDAAASPAAMIDSWLELIVEGVREEKLTARACQAALDMARIRELAAGDSAFEGLVSTASFAMAAATHNHATELLPGGICSADEQITPQRAHNVRAGASRDDTRAGVIQGHSDGTAARMCERSDCKKRRVEAAAQEGAAGPQDDNAKKAHSGRLGAAGGDAQGKARREERIKSAAT